MAMNKHRLPLLPTSRPHKCKHKRHSQPLNKLSQLTLNKHQLQNNKRPSQLNNSHRLNNRFKLKLRSIPNNRLLPRHRRKPKQVPKHKHKHKHKQRQKPRLKLKLRQRLKLKLRRRHRLPSQEERPTFRCPLLLMLTKQQLLRLPRHS
jgi:hypothetical protein